MTEASTTVRTRAAFRKAHDLRAQALRDLFGWFRRA